MGPAIPEQPDAPRDEGEPGEADEAEEAEGGGQESSPFGAQVAADADDGAEIEGVTDLARRVLGGRGHAPPRLRPDD